MPALLDQTVASGSTLYVAVPIHHDAIGLHIGWRDATSAATVTLELTSKPSSEAATEVDGDAWDWVDSGESIAGPDGTAAGAVLVHLDNVRQRRARLKFVTTADCDLFVYDGATDDVNG